MAKLILTDEEKKATSWLHLDDESLGKVVKMMALKLQDHCRFEKIVRNPENIPEIEGQVIPRTDEKALDLTILCMMICNMTANAGVEEATYSLQGLTYKGKPVGDYSVIVKKTQERRCP